MKRAWILTWMGLLLSVGMGWADTALVFVTPRNLKDTNFTLKSKTARNQTVEFTIRRDVSKVEGPGKSGYLSNPAVDGKGLGLPIPLKEEGKALIFQFAVPEDRVAGSVFTLWGRGLDGEGVTYRFNLAEFRKPGKGSQLD